MSAPIPCELFDYIEIACMFAYKVKLTLDDQQELIATPVSTRTSQDKVEYLLVKPEGTGAPEEIDTSRLRKMTVLTEGARFKQVEFPSH